MAKRKKQVHAEKEFTFHPIRVGLTLGLLSAVYALLLVIMGAITEGWGSALRNILSNLYVGYEVSLKGAIIGMVWSFFDGFVAGYLFVVIYNLLKQE